MMMSNTPYPLLVSCEEGAILLPVAYIIPTKVNRNDSKIVCIFQNTIVDRNCLQCRPDFSERCLFAGCSHSIDDLVNLLRQIRKGIVQFFRDCLNLPDKHATVPDVVTILQVAFRRCQVGFFYKSLGVIRLVTMPLFQGSSKAYIPIACFWSKRFDAPGDKISLFG